MKSKAIRAFEAAWAKDQSDSPGLPRSDVEKQIHRDLTGWLTFHRAVLIGELIPLALGYLRNNPQAPEIGRYTHVLVDEYQDLTKAEQVLVDLLTTQSDCMVVGDRNQSVYSFRYAKRDGLSDYAARHPGTQASDLSLCRRCPTAVVGLASELIANNPQMDQKTLTPDPTKDAGFLECRQWPTLDDQVEGATRYVQWLMRARGIPPGEILVISPSRQIGYAIRDNLVAKDVTALSYFAEEALEELEAQTNFALLSLLANPEDRVSLRYWLGVGSGTHNRREYARLRAFCGNNGLEPMDALAQLLEQDAVGIPTLLARYSELQRQLVAHGGEQGQSLLDSLFPPEQEWAKEIRSLAGEAVHGDVGPRDLHDLLRDQVAQPGLPMQVSHVRVMSLHKAKGLTARAVVIAGCVNGLIPRAWSPEKSTLPTEDEHRQEQRRLFYVALTRTTEHLLICGFRLVPVAQARRMGMPDGVRRGTEFGYTMSSFLSELGDHLPAATTSMSFG